MLQTWLMIMAIWTLVSIGFGVWLLPDIHVDQTDLPLTAAVIRKAKERISRLTN